MSITYSNTNIKNTMTKSIIPTAISNLELWIDFTDANTVTLNGSDVSVVSDKTINNRDAAQATAVNQPEYVLNVHNSLNAARCDSSEYMLGGPVNISGNQAATVFMVCNERIDHRGNIFSHGQNASAFSNREYGTFTSNETTINLGGARTVYNEGLPIGNPTIYFVLNDAGDAARNYDAYIDGVKTTRRTGASDSFAANTVDVKYQIAAGGNSGTNPFDGDVFEILLYSRRLSNAETNIILRYLSKKYNISVTYL